MVTGSSENYRILRLLFKNSLVNPKCFKCLNKGKLWSTNPFILDDLFVFLHHDSIVLTISLNFSGSLHGRIIGASLAKFSKFSSKYVIHRSSKSIFSTLSRLMGLSLILMFVYFVLRTSPIASDISFALALCANSWQSGILSMWITSSGINNSSRVKTTWQKMIKTNTEKLQICLNSSQLEGKGWVKTTHNPSFHKNSKLVSRLCIQSNLTKQMPIKVSKPGLQVYFLWKLLWRYPKLNNPIGGRKFLWLGYCNLSKAGAAT